MPARPSHTKRSKNTTAKHDPWAELAPQPKVKAPKSVVFKGSSLAPAVPIPHAGQSINPDSETYAELLANASKMEMKSINRDRKEKRRAQRDMQKQEEAVRTEPKEEDRAGVSGRVNGDNNEVKSEDGEIVSEVADKVLKLSSNAAVTTENRKSRTQQNKENRLRVSAAKARTAKSEKRLSKDLNNLGSLVKQVEAAEKLKAQRQAVKSQERARRILREAAGQCAEQPLDVALDTSDSLRTVQVLAAGAIRERMASMVRRRLAVPARHVSGANLKFEKHKAYHKKKNTKFLNPKDIQLM